MNDIAISARHIGKCYRVFENHRSRLLHYLRPSHTEGMREVWALRDINFEIKRGESVAIIGRNGGGKSTLLEILTGTLTPTVGEVTVNGRVSALLELGSGFNPEYSGRDNVMLNGLLLGLTKEDILSRFGEIEAFAEIGAAIDRPVKTYSSGMMVRLAFAVQILSDPDILIIDEALSVGDFFFQQKCLTYIRQLRERGVTLLFVSHDMGAVRDTCERGILLRAGQISFDGSNLQAIRHYLNTDGDRVPDKQDKQDIQAEEQPATAPASKALQLIEDPFWESDLSAISPDDPKAAYIVSVGMFDLNEVATSNVRMGTRTKFRVHLRSATSDEFHVHLEIKNKHNQLLFSTGTYNMKIPPPKLRAGEDVVFEFDVELAIEAGAYVFTISVVQPSSDGTSGVVIDNTPWLGPFHVHWDYETTPPPFYGMVGMNCSGRFLTP